MVKAYDLLAQEGVIVRRQGAGCFVTKVESALHDSERDRRLAELLEKTVTEAFHLGHGPSEIRAALGRALDKVQFPKRRSRRS